MKLPKYSKADVFRGLTIYAAGDSIAALLLHEFSIVRLLGMMCVGGFLYSLEIPVWFDYINTRYSGLKRTLMAILYFNPLWIARHLVFIYIFNGQGPEVQWGVLYTALISFVVNLPVAFVANYLIQNVISLRWRFFSSAVFSALLSIYYALCRVLF